MTNQSREELFKAVQAEHEKFKLALGNLMLSWADAESALYCVLRHYAGVSNDVARAIFSGTRAKGMMEFINNIAHNTNMDAARRNDLATVFSHMGAINTMRDRLVHNSSAGEIQFEMDDPGSRWLTNENRASRRGNEFRYSVGSALIENMNSDLLSICWHLLAHRDSVPFQPWSGMSGREQPYAWLYRPPQPTGDSGKSDTAPRKPKAPPLPSRKKPASKKDQT